MRRVYASGMLIALVITSGCAKTRLRSVGYPVIGERPAIGTDAHANQGEVVYAKFDYAVMKAVRLLADASVAEGISLTTGDILKPEQLNPLEGYRYCRTATRLGQRDKVEEFICCLVLSERADRVLTTTLENGGRRRTGQWTAAIPSLRFEMVELPVPSLSRSTPGIFRKEIVFQGAAAGVIRILYREYTHDMIRAAFSQELTYEHRLGETTTISVKNARIEVRNAGNAGIDYVVLSGF